MLTTVLAGGLALACGGVSGSTAEIIRADVGYIARGEFDAADANRDFRVTEDEFLAAVVGSWQALTPSVADYLRQRFAFISQGDGELTEDELRLALDEDFSAADSDGDDVLSGEEVELFASLRTGDMGGQ